MYTKKLAGPIVGATYGGGYGWTVGTFADGYVNCGIMLQDAEGFVTKYKLTKLPDWLATGKSLYCPDTKRTVSIVFLSLDTKTVQLDSYSPDWIDFLDRVSSGYYVKRPSTEEVTRYKWDMGLDYQDALHALATGKPPVAKPTKWFLWDSGSIGPVDVAPYPSSSGFCVSVRPKDSTSTYVVADRMNLFDTESEAYRELERRKTNKWIVDDGKVVNVAIGEWYPDGTVDVRQGYWVFSRRRKPEEVFDTEAEARREADKRLTKWMLNGGKVIKVITCRSYPDNTHMVHTGAGSLAWAVQRSDLFDTEAEALAKLNTRWAVLGDRVAKVTLLRDQSANLFTVREDDGYTFYLSADNLFDTKNSAIDEAVRRATEKHIKPLEAQRTNG